MMPNFSRWKAIAIVAGVVLLLVLITIGLFSIGDRHIGPLVINWGWFFVLILVGILSFLAIKFVPMFVQYYKFNKYYKANEEALKNLPRMLQNQRSAGAVMQFDNLMQNAPDSAYIYYMKAFFYQTSGKFGEALSSARKALAMADKDMLLEMILQQSGGQMGQPTTKIEFKEQLTTMCATLEPKVSDNRQRREKAVEKRKKKSR
ncbi:MAG: hypothetical protein WCO98_05080 [bacterium]